MIHFLLAYRSPVRRLGMPPGDTILVHGEYFYSCIAAFARHCKPFLLTLGAHMCLG